MSDMQPSAPPGISPQPVPLQVGIQQFVRATGPNGEQWMLPMQIVTVTGVTVVFLDRQITEQLVQILSANLQQWPEALIVPRMDLGQLSNLTGSPNGNRP